MTPRLKYTTPSQILKNLHFGHTVVVRLCRLRPRDVADVIGKAR